MIQTKKTYEAPKLEVHGTVEELTQYKGGRFADRDKDEPGPHHTGTHP